MRVCICKLSTVFCSSVCVDICVFYCTRVPVRSRRGGWIPQQIEARCCGPRGALKAFHAVPLYSSIKGEAVYLNLLRSALQMFLLPLFHLYI